LEIINIIPVIIIALEIVTRITISFIIIIIFRTSYTLYIENPNTILGNIYQRNKKLKRLDLKPEIFINLIRSLVIAIYN
jgi:hypothetical protein